MRNGRRGIVQNRPDLCRRAGGAAATSERDKLIVGLLGDTGMRVGELLALTAADVRVAGGRNLLMVRGKRDRERLVPVRPAVARRLLRHATKARPEDASSSRIFSELEICADREPRAPVSQRRRPADPRLGG